MDTGLGDAILTGKASIDGNACRLAAMDFSFLGGSMGSVVGERFARACERAAEERASLVSSPPRAARGCRRGSSR